MPHFRQQALSTGSCSGRVYSVGIGACAAGSGYELQVSVDGAERRHAVVYAAPAPAPLQQPYSGCVLVRGNALDDRMLVLTPGGLFLLTPSAPEAPSFRVQGCLVCSHALDARWHPLSADHFGALVREPRAGGSAEGPSGSSSSSSALLSFCAHLGMAPFRTDEWRLPPSAAPRVAFAYGVPCGTATAGEGGGEGGAAAAARYSRVWECLSAFVLDRDGALGVLSPAVPSGLVVASGLWQALREDVQQRSAEWRVEERRLAAQSQSAQWLEGAWAAVGGAAHQYRGCRATAAFAGQFPPPAFQGPIPIYPAALWAGAELVDLCVLPSGPAPAVLCLAGDSRVAVCRGWEGISPAWAAPPAAAAAAAAAAGRGAGGAAADAPCVACPLLHNRPPTPSVAARKSEARLRRMAMGSPLARALLQRSLQQPAEPSGGAERGALSQQLPAELSSEELGTPWLWLLAAYTVRSDGACAQRAWAPCLTPAGPLRPSTVLLCSRLGGLLALRVDGLEEELSCEEASAKRIKHTLTLSLRPLGVLAGGGSVTCGGTVGRRIRSGSGPGARDVWDYPIVSYGAPLPLPEALLLQARSGAAGASACIAVPPGPPRLSLPRRSADLQWDRDPLVVGAGSSVKGARGSSDAAGEPTGLSLSHKECLRGMRCWAPAAEELAGVEGAAAAAAAAPAAAAPAAAAALHHGIVTAASKACTVVAQRAVELLTLAEALKDDQGALHARCQDAVQRAHAVEVRVHSFAERAQGWEARVEQVGSKTRGLLSSARALTQRVTAGLGGQEYLQSVADEQELVGLLRDLRVLQAQILSAPLL